MKVKRVASTRVVARSAGKQSSKKLAPLKLPENDDDGAFRARGKKRKGSEIATRENFDHGLDIENILEDVEGGEEGEKKIKSVFRKEFAEIKKRIAPDAELRVDETAAAFYRVSLSLIMDLMPVAEENYRLTRKEGSAYVISTLINQARDLNNDLRLSEDIEGRLVTVNTLIHSAFVRVAELLLREMRYNMATAVDGITSDTTIRKAIRKQMETSVVSYGHGLGEFEKMLKMQIGMYLRGDPNYLNPVAEGEEEKPSKQKKRKKKNG